MKVVCLSLLVFLMASSAALAAKPTLENGGHTYPPIPVGPSAGPDDVRGLLYARWFTLEEPYPYRWRHDAPSITSGWLLVVSVTPELAVQRATLNPVLYAGRYPVAIQAVDPELGRMVAIVPGDVDLMREPIFFGSLEVPEDVTPQRAEEEMQAAIVAGFEPLTSEAVRPAQQAGGTALHLVDGYELRSGPLADVIEQYAPAARGVAEGLRAPRVSAP